MALYVLDENNNKIEVTTEVLTALVEQIKCCVSGTPYKMAFITQAKHNELKAAGTLVENCYYFIIDDTTADDIDTQLKDIIATLEEHTIKYDQLANALAAKKLYQHDITITNVESTYSIVITLRYLGKTETPITADNIIYALGGIGNTPASGYLKIVSNGNIYPVYKVESLENISSSTTQFKVYFPANTDNTNGNALVSKDRITITDNVKALM